MKDFKKGGFKGGFRDKNRGGRQGGFGGKKQSFGGRDRGFREEREMFEAVCNECGNSCEVPFRPTGDRPVLCDNCFGGGRPERQNFQQQTRRGNDRNDRGARTEQKPDHRIDELNHSVSELSSSIRDIMEKLNSIESILSTKTESPTDLPETKVTKKTAAKKVAKKVSKKTK